MKTRRENFNTAAAFSDKGFLVAKYSRILGERTVKFNTRGSESIALNSPLRSSEFDN